MNENLMAKKNKSSLNLKLTKKELEHLRDLFSIRMTNLTLVSAEIASFENRTKEEERLWGKLRKLCEDSGIPLDKKAPDHVILSTDMCISTIPEHINKKGKNETT